LALPVGFHAFKSLPLINSVMADLVLPDAGVFMLNARVHSCKLLQADSARQTKPVASKRAGRLVNVVIIQIPL
jgi:hypothetical protein